MTEPTQDVSISKARGRPMLTWVGKRPLGRVTAYPAQKIERFAAGDAAESAATEKGTADWSDWPQSFERGGLLFHGDNKDVLAHLLANGFRGKVKLIYIDPPFDSGADYVRKVQLRGPRGAAKIEGEDYSLGEQVQYTDIWASDNYLQFMYERLQLLNELLHDEGSIYLHCDQRISSQMRLVIEEVFGQSNFRNWITWKSSPGHSDHGFFGAMQNHILFATKGAQPTWNPQFQAYDDDYLGGHYQKSDPDGRRFEDADLTAYGLAGGGYDYVWNGHRKIWRCPETTMQQHAKAGLLYYTKNGIARYKRYLEDMPGAPLSDLWTDVARLNSQASEKEDYPTQKPEPLVQRVMQASSNAGDLILDCFIGSGTTAAVAQKLGRRWIGCDINKGAIQTTAKRLQAVMAEQAAATADAKQANMDLSGGDTSAALADGSKPAQLSFTTWRVNDYDLTIQHNEAVALVCEHLGVTASRTEPFFDGTLGQRLVKIVPLNHPLSPLDCEALSNEIKTRAAEERDIVLVCLGIEQKAREWVDKHNKNHPVNKIDVIELRTDRKMGGVFQHEPMSVALTAQREGKGDKAKLVVEINEVVSPTILKRLSAQDGVLRAEIADWRAVVDCVLIDSDHDGAVFNVTLSDLPPRKQDLVAGRYELPAPRAGATVAVKVIDMLGEEHVTLVVP